MTLTEELLLHWPRHAPALYKSMSVMPITANKRQQIDLNDGAGFGFGCASDDGLKLLTQIGGIDAPMQTRRASRAAACENKIKKCSNQSVFDIIRIT